MASRVQYPCPSPSLVGRRSTRLGVKSRRGLRSQYLLAVWHANVHLWVATRRHLPQDPCQGDSEDSNQMAWNSSIVPPRRCSPDPCPPPLHRQNTKVPWCHCLEDSPSSRTLPTLCPSGHLSYTQDLFFDHPAFPVHSLPAKRIECSRCSMRSCRGQGLMVSLPYPYSHLEVGDCFSSLCQIRSLGKWNLFGCSLSIPAYCPGCYTTR